jgi:hypothetical protein
MDVKRVIEEVSEARVLCVSVCPATREIICGCEDGTLVAYDLDSGKRLAAEVAHGSWVTGLAATGDTSSNG